MEPVRHQKSRKAKQNVILIGMPGVGKSTIGVIAAKLLGLRFVDTDLLIQEQEDRLLSEIIEEEGVDGFLAIEDALLAGLKAKGSLIATGGSAVYGQEAMENLGKLGTIVYLELGYPELSRRLGDLKMRGVVSKGSQTLRDLYLERIPLYEKYAHKTIREDGLGVEETVEKLIQLLQENE